MTARGDSTKRIDTHRTALDITTATDAHNNEAGARRHQARRSVGRSRTRQTSAPCVGASAPCICARPATPPRPQSFLHVCARRQHAQQARLTGDLRTGGRTTSNPVHGCLPPPSKGGSRGPGRGRTPPQHTILRLEPALPKRVYLSQSSIFISALPKKKSRQFAK